MTDNKNKVKMKIDIGRGIGDTDTEVEFPDNSNGKKKEKKEVTKVITGDVMTKKKSMATKLSANLLGDDGDSISSYIMQDILIPSAKNTVFEMFSSLADMLRGSVELALFGRRTSGRDGSRNKGPYVSYDKYYNKKDIRSKYDDIPFKRELPQKARSTHNFDDVTLTSRGDAEEVLSHLVDLTETYGVATVADLYELIGVTGEYTDNKYGWDSLGTASISRVRGGYLINLPRTRLLD